MNADQPLKRIKARYLRVGMEVQWRSMLWDVVEVRRHFSLTAYAFLRQRVMVVDDDRPGEILHRSRYAKDVRFCDDREGEHVWVVPASIPRCIQSSIDTDPFK